MLNEEKIKLTGVEQAAYWWTNRLMYMTRYFALRYERKVGHITPDEVKFLSLFYNYTDKEWRDLYLKLTEFITEDVNSFEPTGDVIGIDAFSQDTTKGRHARLNAELAKITGVKGFPDIRLADSGYKDEVIYADWVRSYVWYKSCGTRPLEISYDPTYILSGNEKELKLYNNLVSTFAFLDKTKSHDMDLFRMSFCKAYKRLNAPTEDIVKIRDLFNKCYHLANERKLVTGRFWDKTFFPNLLKYDYAGLSGECMQNGDRCSSFYISRPKYLEQRMAEANNSSAPISPDEDTLIK